LSVRLCFLAAAAFAATASTTAVAQSPLQPHEQAIIAYIKEAAFDPDAVQIKFITPLHTAEMKRGIFAPRQTYTWACASWNGKNRYGAYVGFSTDAFLFSDGKIIEMIDNGEFVANISICPR